MMRKRLAQKTVSEPLPESVQLLDIPEVARRLHIGRTKVYRLIKTDGLPVVKIGDVTRVSVRSLQKWVAQREQAS